MRYGKALGFLLACLVLLAAALPATASEDSSSFFEGAWSKLVEFLSDSPIGSASYGDDGAGDDDELGGHISPAG